ncbi:hypothetical protein [Bacillus pseudomycoides]|nr:hypothetical protein [Bacillus pseudomycoides]
MIAEKERTESRRQQAQGIKIVKEKRVIKDDPTFMESDARNPEKQAIYY